MDQLNHIAGIIALTMGVAWASGINLYAAIAMLGILGISENIVLPPGLTASIPLSASLREQYWPRARLET